MQLTSRLDGGAVSNAASAWRGPRGRGGPPHLHLVLSALIAIGCRAEHAPRPPVSPEPEIVSTDPPAPRLRDHLRPTAHELELRIDPDEAMFTGRIAIDLESRARLPVLWLHAEELEIDSTSVSQASSAIEVTGVRTPRDGLLGLSLARPLEPGPARVEISFRGAFRDETGLFVQERDDRRYVFTDLEPVDARLAFPCFDHPRFKAPWHVSLVVPEDSAAFANAPRVSEEPLGDGLTRLRFAGSRPLPAYLIAVAVGPFETVTAATTPVPIRIVTPRGLSGRADDAAAMAPELLREAMRYMRSEAPFPKLDFVSVPRFDGAMENPGLITVAERILLPEGEPISIPDRHLLGMVIAHEIAHLWFGDTVTMAGWNELWLNEGLATWMADELLARWRPDWNTRADQVEARHDAMLLDTPPRTTRRSAVSRVDLNALFDALTYKKGGAVAYMLEGYVGDAVFRRALQRYVAEHAWGPVETADLVAALEAGSDGPIADIVAGFLDRPGVPLIEAAIECADGGARVHVTRRAYRVDAGAESDDRPPRAIPVCIRHPGGRRCTLLEASRTTVPLETDGCPAWIQPNPEGRGYYYWTMPAGAWRALAASGELDDVERADAMHDIRALLAAGEIELDTALAVVSAQSDVAGRHATETALELLTDIREHMLAPAHDPAFAAWAREHYSERGRRLGFAPRPGEPQGDTLLRPHLLRFLGIHADDPRVVESARELTRGWLAGTDEIAPGMMRVTLAIAAAHGDEALFEDLVEAVGDAEDPARKRALWAGLGSFRRAELVRRALALGADRVGRRGRTYIRRAYVVRPRLRPVVLDAAGGEEERSALLALGIAQLCSRESFERAAEMFPAFLPDEARRRRFLATLGSMATRCQSLRERHTGAARRFFSPRKKGTGESPSP